MCCGIFRPQQKIFSRRFDFFAMAEAWPCFLFLSGVDFMRSTFLYLLANISIIKAKIAGGPDFPLNGTAAHLGSARKGLCF